MLKPGKKKVREVRLRQLTIVCIIGAAVLILAGCASKAKTIDGIATIAINEKHTYEQAVKMLGIGDLFDYYLRLPQANKSWVRVWVEGYVNGESLQPEPLVELSYGNNPNQSEEGPLGVGLIPVDNTWLIYAYSPSVKAPPYRLPEEYHLSADSGTNWIYTIGKEDKPLQAGETRIIGIHRQSAANKDMRAYDYTQEQEIYEMIQNEPVVMLVKVQVDYSTKDQK